MKEQAATDAQAAIAEPLEVVPLVLPRRGRSSAATHPCIADIRLAASLEFLRAIDYEFPAWAEEYLSAMESALGDAYSEPAADVRGFVEYARSQN